MKTYRVTVTLGEVDGDLEDEESFKYAVKEAMQAAIDLDDAGDQELDFMVDEDEDEEFLA